jgi:MFS family permease
MTGLPATKTADVVEPPARPTWVRWRIVALLMAFSFMQHFNRTSMAIAGDLRIMDQFCLTPTQMGLVYMAFLLVYTICMTPGGWFSDRHGTWLSLGVMGLGSAFFCILTGLPGYGILAFGLVLPTLIVIRGLMGLFSAPIYPASGRAVSVWIPFPQRSWANALVTGIAFVGIACSYVVFGKLVDWLDWPPAFAIAGGVTGFFGLVWLGYATNRPGQHPSVNEAERRLTEGEEPPTNAAALRQEYEGATSVAAAPVPMPARDGWRALLGNRSLLLLTLSYAAIGYFEYMFQYWMHYYFSDVLHLAEGASRLYAGIPQFALIATVPLGGWLSDRLVRAYGYRLGRAAVPVAGMLASAVFLYVGTLGSGPEWVVTWFTLALGAVGACEGPCWATAIELGGARGATAGGIFNTGGNVGGAVAPYLTPWVGQRYGWSWAINVSSLVCLLGVVFWLWIDPRERSEKLSPGHSELNHRGTETQRN